MDCVALVRPFAQPRYASDPARAVSRTRRLVHGGTSRRARRLGVLSVAFRRSHRSDARPRRRFPLGRALARVRQSTAAWKRSCTIRIRSAICTAASPSCWASAPDADEHKVQWLSTADAGEQFLPLFEEILGSPRLAASQSQFLRLRPAEPRRLQRRSFTQRLGLEDGADIPGTAARAARRRPATRHRARGAAHGRPGEEPMRGRRPGLQRAADQRARTIQRTSSCSRPQAMREPRSARCSTPGTAYIGQTKRASSERPVPGTELFRRRGQEGAGELQAAVPLPADHRRTAAIAPCAN